MSGRRAWGPDALVTFTVLSAALLTTATAGVGIVLEPGSTATVMATVALVGVLAGQAAVLLRVVPPVLAPRPGGLRATPTVLAVLAVATLTSVPLLAPVGVSRGWETWAWVAAGLVGSVPVAIGRRAGAALAVLLTAVSAGVGQWVADSPGTYALLTAGTGGALLLIQLVPLRLGRLVREAQAGRDAAARLAAADERLRFASDVHDLLGHQLTVIALAAELASRTARTDPDAAAAHAERARSCAATALTEMRRVVHGYRATDLDAQLDAVAQVLRASGLRCTVDSPTSADLPDDLADDTAAVLAATAREAGTNVLRHSRARWCTITLVHRDGRAVLTIVNDGATPAVGDTHSSGLRGLTDRLASAAGTLKTGFDDGEFTLRAEVPAP